MKHILLVFTCAAASVLPASDWPKWLGPNGDNIAPADAGFETDLNRWKIAWQGNVGLGYSSIIVAGERAYTMGHGNKQETVYCLNANTGEQIWKYSYDAPLMAHLHTGGPNASPTLAGKNVITLSKNGQVFCLSADKGEFVWKADLLDIFKIKIPEWGFASSPFVDGNQVILSGGKVCALDLASGKTVWVSKDAHLPAGYATSPVYEFDGHKFVAAMDGKGFSILSAQDGSEIWRHPFKALFDMNATTPYIYPQGNSREKHIFISNTIQSEMFQLTGVIINPLWDTKELKNLMNNSVFIDGAIYGISGEQQQPTDPLVSINEADGKENWSQPSIGYGNTIAVGKTLLVLNETGTLFAVKADPQKYTELSQRKVLEQVCWTTATYANGKIYVRNDQGAVVVLGHP